MKFLTRAKEDYSFKVCIFISININLGHAVTELLKFPNVFHDLLYSVSRKLIYKKILFIISRGLKYIQYLNQHPFMKKVK